MLSQRRGVTQSPVRSGGREASCIPRSRPNRTTDAISADSLLLSLRGTPATRQGNADIPVSICLSCDGPGEFSSIPNCAELPVACLERRRAESTVSGHGGGQIADFRAVSRSPSHFLGREEMVGRRERGPPVSGLSSVEYMRRAYVARLSNTINGRRRLWRASSLLGTRMAGSLHQKGGRVIRYDEFRPSLTQLPVL